MAPPLAVNHKMLYAPAIAACMSSGVCEEAKASEKQLFEFLRHAETPYSFSGARAACLAELNDVIEECSEEDWDGYGAAALNAEAIEKAKRFLNLLPTDLPYPEIGAMPDGDISLDWDLGHRRSLTIAIGPQTRLAYAMINGDNEISGTASFVSFIPRSILQTINDLHE